MLDQVSPLAWAFLGSYLYYHVIKSMTSSSRCERLGRRWFWIWAGWQLLRLGFPVVFESSPPDIPIFLNTLVFSIPSFVLFVLPLQDTPATDEDELPLKL